MIDIDERKLKLLKYTVLVLSVVMFIFSSFNFYRREMLIFSIESSFFFIGITLLYFIVKRKYINEIIIIMLSLNYVFTVYISSQDKFNYTLFVWSLIVVGLTFYFINLKYAKYIITIYLSIILFFLIKIFIATDMIPVAAFLNLSAFIIAFTTFLYFYELTRKNAENKLLGEIRKRKVIELENRKLIKELTRSMEEVKQLSSFLPICSNCKSVRDDDGYWQQIEHYITEHSDTQFSHSLCPACAKKLYPEFAEGISEEEHNLSHGMP